MRAIPVKTCRLKYMKKKFIMTKKIFYPKKSPTVSGRAFFN
jgi:hypothetical protein